MDKPEMTEKQIQTLYHQVMTDDTYWDDMNAAELEKRLDDFNAHKRSRNKMISMLSCLRLAPCVYLRERVNDNWTIPIINIPNTPVLMVFSSAEQIKNENFKSFDVADARLPELLESIEMEGEPHIVVNPDTQAVILPLSLVKGMFDICDDVVSAADEQMENGLSAEQLDDEMFEHFFCRKVDCETSDGRHITGDVYMYKKTKQTGGFLLVDTGEEEPAVIYKNEAKFIKDVTPLDEEDVPLKS